MRPGALGGGRGVVAILVLVLRSRIRVGSRQIGAARSRHPIRTTVQGITLLVVGLTTAVTIALVSRLLFSVVTETDQHLVFAAFFVALLSAGIIASSGAALQSIYLAPDLPFLLTMPIPLVSTFTSKFIETLAGTLPIGFIGFWFLAGYASTTNQPILTFLVGGSVLLAYLVMLTALGIVMVAGIARVVPAKRAWTVLGIVSLVIVASLGVWWATIQRDDASSGLTPGISIDAALHAGAAGMVANVLQAGRHVEYTPLGWAARTIAATDGPGLAAWSNGVAFASLSLVSIVGAWWLFAITFATGTSGFRTASAPLPRPSRPIARWTAAGLSYLPVQLAALVLKEWIMMFRDSRRLTGALWPLGMVIVYTINLSRGSPAVTDPAGWGFWQSIGPVIFLPWATSLGTAVYSVGSEHRGVHLLRTLPVDSQLVLTAKVVAGVVPVLVLTTAAAILVAAGNEATLTQLGLVVLFMTWSSVGFVTLDTCASALAPNFVADQVQRTLRLKGRIYSLGAGAVFAAGTVLVVGWALITVEGQPPIITSVDLTTSVGFDPLGWPLAFAGLVISGAVVIASWTLGVTHLDHILIGDAP